MGNLKLIFKIAAAIIVVSAAVCTVFIFRKELTEVFSDVKQKLAAKTKACCGDFVDFDDV